VTTNRSGFPMISLSIHIPFAVRTRQTFASCVIVSLMDV
jgi:hypothetical protein